MGRRLEPALIAALTERGPLTPDQLGQELVARGATAARDPAASARSALSGHRFCELDDGRWIDRVAALDGAVLLHRVTSEERHLSAFRADPDLSVLAGLVRAHLIRPLDGWSDVFVGWCGLDGALSPGPDGIEPVPERYLRVPYEWMREVRPGALVALLVHDGAFALETVRGPRRPPHPEPTIEAVAGERMVRGQRDWLPPHEPIADLLLEALARQPDLLQSATEPVGEMLRRCDLETHREFVGLPLTDWSEIDHRSAIWDLIPWDERPDAAEWHTLDPNDELAEVD